MTFSNNSSTKIFKKVVKKSKGLSKQIKNLFSYQLVWDHIKLMTIFFNYFYILAFSSFQLLQKCSIVVTLLKVSLIKLLFHYYTELLSVLASIFKKQAYHICMLCITIMKEMMNFLIIFNDVMLLIQIIQSFKKVSYCLIIKYERFSSVCNRHRHVIKLQSELKSENKKVEWVYRRHLSHKII